MPSPLFRVIPLQWRRLARKVLTETPHRVRDLLPDLRDQVSSTRIPLPPPALRRRVSRSSSRREFLAVGIDGSRAVLDAFNRTRKPSETYPRWLDFGCGPGRLGRHLSQSQVVREIWGLDVDADAIAWDRDHLPGQYWTIERDPPTNLEPDSVDVVVAVSVFTHLNERMQLSWLRELHRLLRPGGRLMATTHSPALTFTRPDLNSAQYAELQKRGFLFAHGGPNFNDGGAFHSHAYLMETWGKLFGLLLFRNHGMTAFQDLSVWTKW